MYEKKIEKLNPKEIGFADLSENNDVIVETAGFVPLEVKLKRFEQNGLIAKFNESEFTSSDIRDIYLNPDFEISPEDDFEEVQEKLIAQQKYINEIRSKKTPDISVGNSGVAPQAENENQVEKKSSLKNESVNENQVD